MPGRGTCVESVILSAYFLDGGVAGDTEELVVVDGDALFEGTH